MKSFFSEHLPNCLAVHEPSHKIKLLSNLYLSKRISEQYLENFLKRYKGRIDDKLAGKGCDTYVQIDPWLIGFVGILDKVFAGPYIIHIVRDPLTYIPSILNRYYKETVKGFLRDVIPYWKLRGDKTGDYSSRTWHKMSYEERMAWHWVKHNDFIESEKHKMSRFLTIKYEDVFDDNNSGLINMLQFCGFETTEDQLTHDKMRRKINIARQNFPESSEWTNEVYNNVVNICKPHMEKYGYPVTDEKS